MTKSRPQMEGLGSEAALGSNTAGTGRARKAGAATGLTARSSGRPRDPEADDAILAAALHHMAEQGYQRMSLDLVACTAKVSKATIYRRWSSKADLAIAALATRIDAEPPEEQKTFTKEALINILDKIRTRLLQPNNMALVGTLLAEERQTPDLIDLFRKHVWKRRSDSIKDILELGKREGKIPPMTDLNPVIDMLVGSMYASYLRNNTIPPQWPKQVVDTIWKGLSGR